MPTTSTPSPPTNDRASSPDFCAVLLLDSVGRITGGNTSAAELSPGRTLVGEAFASLFAFEIVSADPDFLEAQWEGLLASALNRPTTLTLQAGSQSPARAVRLRLEAAAGTPGGYVATLQPPAAAPTVADTDDTGAALRLLSEKGSTGFFDLNFQAGRVHLSPAWKRLLGYAPSELPDTAESWRKLIHPDDTAAAPDSVGRKIAPGPRPISVEYRMKHRRGHWVWIHCLGLQIVGAPGEVDRVVGLHFDISDRKELEDLLIANDLRLQDLSGSGPLAAFELDFANESFWFSPAWERLLGYEKGELPTSGAAFATALPPEEATAGVAEWLLTRAAGESTWLQPVKLHLKNGKPIPVLLGAALTVSRKRELLRAVGFACPLPAGAAAGDGQVPAALNDEAYATLAEAVLITDARERVIFANPAASRLLRASPAALRGQLLGDIVRLVDRQSGRPCASPFDAVRTADGPLGLILTDALAPGAEGESPTPIVWTATEVAGPDRRTQGGVMVFRNPEEMTLTREELIRADRSRSIALFSGRVAHDLNNLFFTIVNSIAVARASGDLSKLDDAEKACDTAKALSKQLHSAVLHGAATPQVCRPVDILEDSRKIASAGTDALVEIEIPEGIENICVERAPILQVFQNLIVNALQAMPGPPHRPWVRLRACNAVLAEGQEPGLDAGDYVEFEVSDNGSGIQPEHLEKIFDAFFTTKKHGTGLGLATVASVVRRHGGRIRVASEVGAGTAFTLFLPKAEAPFQPVRQIPALHHRTGRILFMDDDPNIAALTVAMLTNLGYTQVDVARNGEEAVALYRRNQVALGPLSHGRRYYDAIITDLNVVGGMGGEECFRELQKMDPEVRVIAASGYDDDAIEREFLEKGFLGYLAKPYREKDLGKKLKEVLG